MDVLFAVRHLKVQPRHQCILSVPALDLPKNKHIAIIGPNGAGKSTLLRALLGLNGGEVSLNGDRVHNQIKQGVLAWVGQHGQFNLPLTVVEYVQLSHRTFLRRQNRLSDKKTRLNQLLEQFDLQHLARQRIGSLSGGEQQRANIVRALLQNAPVLLLDEPCNHLDIRHQQRLMSYLRQHKADFSVVMVLHDLTMAANYADFVVLMNQGAVVAAGNTEEVMQPERLSAIYQWPITRICEEEMVFFRMGMAEKII
ncbi:ABC transporter ATP-binding protein [Neisseriaceae bacterium ESL0693]|nr:ABC transporter ATP-binding protein [Neisseriaceae bacterium ESL0693]